MVIVLAWCLSWISCPRVKRSLVLPGRTLEVTTGNGEVSWVLKKVLEERIAESTEKFSVYDPVMTVGSVVGVPHCTTMLGSTPGFIVEPSTASVRIGMTGTFFTVLVLISLVEMSFFLFSLGVTELNFSCAVVNACCSKDNDSLVLLVFLRRKENILNETTLVSLSEATNVATASRHGTSFHKSFALPNLISLAISPLPSPPHVAFLVPTHSFGFNDESAFVRRQLRKSSNFGVGHDSCSTSLTEFIFIF